MCGWEIRRLDRSYPRDASRSELEEAVIRADGSCLLDVSFCRIDQELTARGNWEWLTGAVGGELLRGFWWGQEALWLGRTSRVNYEALFDYRIRPSVAALAKDSMSSWPSIQRHNEVLMEPYRQIGRAGGKRLNAYKLDVILQYRLCYSAGNSHSWLAGLRSIRLPFLSWEFTRVVLSLPWQLRRTRDLSLRVIRRLNPLLSEIPNDTGAPMMPLGLGSGSAYLRVGIAKTSRKAALVIRRTLGRLGARKTSNPRPPPGSWVECLIDSAQVRSLFGQAAVREVCDGAMSPAPSLKEIRAVYGLLDPGIALEQVSESHEGISFQGRGMPVDPTGMTGSELGGGSQGGGRETPCRGRSTRLNLAFPFPCGQDQANPDRWRSEWMGRKRPTPPGGHGRANRGVGRERPTPVQARVAVLAQPAGPARPTCRSARRRRESVWSGLSTLSRPIP